MRALTLARTLSARSMNECVDTRTICESALHENAHPLHARMQSTSVMNTAAAAHTQVMPRRENECSRSVAKRDRGSVHAAEDIVDSEEFGPLILPRAGYNLPFRAPS